MNHSLRSADATTHLKVVCLFKVVCPSLVAVLTAPGTLTSASWSMP